MDIPTKNDCEQCMFLIALYPRGSESVKVDFLSFYDNTPISLSGEETV